MDENTVDASSQKDDKIAALEKRVAELEAELRAARVVNSGADADADTRLTYCDLGISSEDIFDIIEAYTLTSAVIFLTKEKLAKIMRHHVVRRMDQRCRDTRTFLEVLDLRIHHLTAGLEKLRESAGNHTDAATEMETIRLRLAIRNLIYIRDNIVGD